MSSYISVSNYNVHFQQMKTSKMRSPHLQCLVLFSNLASHKLNSCSHPSGANLTDEPSHSPPAVSASPLESEKSMPLLNTDLET